MPSSLQNMCRTCMLNASKQQVIFTQNKAKIKTQMISIFTVPEDSKVELCLVEILKTTAPQLKIEENDQLPKIVCLECSEKIEEMYLFQQNCVSVEQNFYKMLEQHDTNDPSDDNKDTDILKTEFDNNFVEETSMQSDDDLILDDNIKKEGATKQDFIEKDSDLSIDFEWDEKSDSDWEDEQIESLSKISEKSATFKREEIDDEVFQTYSYDDDDDDEFDEFEPTITKKSHPVKNIATEQLYPCDRCKKKLRSKLSYKKHQEMHDKKDNEEPKFVCNVCDRAFKKCYKLNDHLRSHSGEKPYLCSECGKGFTRLDNLKQHSLRHLNEKQFACPGCPKTFPTKRDLTNHYGVHKARAKSHICDVCGRGFHKLFLLKKHKMYHTNDRQFPCEYCEKRFFTNEKLKRHTRIHTGEKPFKCKYCEKAYCQSSELIKHLRCHLGDNVYQCAFCPLRFPSVKILREHFSTHKNDDEETRTRNLAELNAMETKGVFIK